MFIEPAHPELSIRRQCELLQLNRSSFYYEPIEVDAAELELLHQLDREYTAHPFYGSRRLAVVLSQQLGFEINRKRIQRLMRQLGVAAVQPRRSTSTPHPQHRIYPYLLRNVKVLRVGQVYSSDITYIPMKRGFLYLMCVIDWYSRYILSWKLSNTLHVDFCLEGLSSALSQGAPEVFNTDQGSQFTSPQWIQRVEAAGAKVSMDGRGRALDNIWIERFWRSLKYEEVYLKEYSNGQEAWRGIDDYITFYNTERPHQGLRNQTPAQVFARAS